MGFAIHGIAVVNDLGGTLARPGHDSHGIGVGPEDHICIGWFDEVPVAVGTPGHALDHDAFREPGIALLRNSVGLDKLAARAAGHIRHEHFNFGNFVALQPIL